MQRMLDLLDRVDGGPDLDPSPGARLCNPDGCVWTGRDRSSRQLRRSTGDDRDLEDEYDGCEPDVTMSRPWGRWSGRGKPAGLMAPLMTGSTTHRMTSRRSVPGGVPSRTRYRTAQNRNQSAASLRSS
jgi:hypothetical protein